MAAWNLLREPFEHVFSNGSASPSMEFCWEFAEAGDRTAGIAEGLPDSRASLSGCEQLRAFIRACETEAVTDAHAFVFTNSEERLSVARARAEALLQKLAK